MINFTKELPQNKTVIQSDDMEHNSKVPMTAPSRGSLYPKWRTRDNNGDNNGQQWATIDNN